MKLATPAPDCKRPAQSSGWPHAPCSAGWNLARTRCTSDRRTPDQRIHNCPPNKLSDGERQLALGVLNSEEFKDLPPSQSVPHLADQGRYVVSESNVYRLLRQVGQLAHRSVRCQIASPKQWLALGE